MKKHFLIGSIAWALFLCATLGQAFSASQAAQETPLRKVIYAAGYIPNVQFAPFYVAIARGYFRAEGIDLEIDYTIGSNILKMTALNKVQFASSDPDALLHATARDLPLVHVATLYQSYPIALIAREPILDAAALKGKRIGISGAYGSSYLGLKAMLAEMGLTLADVHVVTIGYTQVAALHQAKVDAVVGYINNEPARLRAMGLTIHTRTLGARTQLPGVGLMTGTLLLKTDRALVDAFLRATFRGVKDVLDDPEACYQLVVAQFLPELSGSDQFEAERQTLHASLPFLTSDYVTGHGFGQCDPARWEALAGLLQKDQENTDYGRWREWVDRRFSWKP